MTSRQKDGQIEFETWNLFISAMDTGSLLQSARISGLDPSTVSRRLRQLEEALSTQLFYRDNTGVYPTVAGQGVLERVRPILRAVDETRTELTRQAVAFRGSYRVFLPAALNAPAFYHFFYSLSVRYPELHFSFAAGAAPTESDAEADLVLSCASGRTEGFEDAGSLELGCFASETYLRHEGAPLSPEGLLAHRLLAARDVPLRKRAVFSRGEEEVSIPLARCALFSSGPEALAAAEAGGGIAVNVPVVLGETFGKSLVRVLAPWALPGLPVGVRVQGRLRGTYFSSYLVTLIRRWLNPAPEEGKAETLLQEDSHDEK